MPWDRDAERLEQAPNFVLQLGDEGERRLCGRFQSVVPLLGRSLLPSIKYILCGDSTWLLSPGL